MFSTAGELGYLELLQDVMANGHDRPDRTGVGTRSVFGRELRFDLSHGEFPLMTTKKMEIASVFSELLWFLEGSGDERRLAELRYDQPREQLVGKSTIWTPNATAPYWAPKAKFEGDLGRPYGVQLRHWTNRHGVEVDQLVNLIDGLKNDPFGRRHLICWWNPGELDEMALPACHVLAQFYVTQEKLDHLAGEVIQVLHCKWTQRSVDAFLGLPYNIASYALLLRVLAAHLGEDWVVGDLIFSGGDVHIYANHFYAVEEQVSRRPYDPPMLMLDVEAGTPIENIRVSDADLIGYKHHPAIRAPMAV